jgi:phosphatidylethanolamine/phosphatidyl-N-methylethanolamine N-methyltransferase
VTTLERYLPQGLALFVRGWVEDPMAVGAVAPSGRRLARLMTRDVGPGSRVVEFGPGTGPVTRALLERGVQPRDLVLIERSGRFVPVLQREFPEVTIICGDAVRKYPALGSFEGRTDCVICGLPLVLFSTADKRALLQRCFELLRRDGAVYQLTYSGRCPVGRKLLDELGLEAVRLGVTLFNLPPAFVYRVGRRRG